MEREGGKGEVKGSEERGRGVMTGERRKIGRIKEQLLML